LKTKVAAILLFLGLCAPVVLSFNYLRIQKKLIRKEVKHHLIEQTKLDDLVLLSFSVEESQEILKWKHEKEFEFDGEMYDVVKRESRDDSLFLLVLVGSRGNTTQSAIRHSPGQSAGKSSRSQESKAKVKAFFTKPLSLSVACFQLPGKQGTFTKSSLCIHSEAL
jgi:hypothetical protein